MLYVLLSALDLIVKFVGLVRLESVYVELIGCDSRYG
jgi:hypothetical protein